MSEFKVKFRGTRGSYPTPKKDFLEFGGNTSCVEINVGGNVVILDAGYGIIDVGHELSSKKESINAVVLLSHTHLDHIQGLPFFEPIHSNSNIINVFGHCSSDKNLREVLSNALFGDVFPLNLNDIKSEINIRNFSDDEVIILNKNNELKLELAKSLHNIKLNEEDVLISSYKNISHPKEGSLCIKIQHNSKTLVYATDIEGIDDEKFIEFSIDADLLIHDAQYTKDEYDSEISSRKGYGHSTFEMAIENAKKANVKKLMFFHHSPGHDDKFLSVLEEKYTAISPKYSFAKENLEIIL